MLLSNHRSCQSPTGDGYLDSAHLILNRRPVWCVSVCVCVYVCVCVWCISVHVHMCGISASQQLTSRAAIDSSMSVSCGFSSSNFEAVHVKSL